MNHPGKRLFDRDHTRTQNIFKPKLHNIINYQVQNLMEVALTPELIIK